MQVCFGGTCCTLLHAAASAGQTLVVASLLSLGADMLLTDDNVSNLFGTPA